MEDWRRWRGNRNRLPNLQLLEGRSNGSKNAMRLVDYYNDMNEEQKAMFRKEALIPDDVSLELEKVSHINSEALCVLISIMKAQIYQTLSVIPLVWMICMCLMETANRM